MSDPNDVGRQARIAEIANLRARLVEADEAVRVALAEGLRWRQAFLDVDGCAKVDRARAERAERDVANRDVLLAERQAEGGAEEVRQWLLARGPVVDEALKHDDAHDLLATAIWAGCHRPKAGPTT